MSDLINFSTYFVYILRCQLSVSYRLSAQVWLQHYSGDLYIDRYIIFIYIVIHVWYPWLLRDKQCTNKEKTVATRHHTQRSSVTLGRSTTMDSFL